MEGPHLGHVSFKRLQCLCTDLPHLLQSDSLDPYRTSRVHLYRQQHPGHSHLPHCQLQWLDALGIGSQTRPGSSHEFPDCDRCGGGEVRCDESGPGGADLGPALAGGGDLVDHCLCLWHQIWSLSCDFMFRSKVHPRRMI